MNLKTKYALISVSEKTGIVEFSRQLINCGYHLLSTGGTAKLLTDKGLPVQEVADYTGFPEMMQGRVKTLHPKIHGGILGRRGVDDDIMQKQGILAIDLVVVNLYPFTEVIAKPETALELAVENIDIGGPAMLRSAAKNYQRVGVVVDSDDYSRVIDALEKGGELSGELRFELAIKAFQHTHAYDGAIAQYLSNSLAYETIYPKNISLKFKKRYEMRYGENPHQSAAFYVEENPASQCIASALQLQGKALSFNNISDADSALKCVQAFSQKAACVIVKHANPCGVAQSDTQLDAYLRAFSTDPESAFGGIIAFNSELESDTAQAILQQQFVEVIIAPSVSTRAQAILQAKENVRVLTLEKIADAPNQANQLELKQVGGGVLLQTRDAGLYESLKVVTSRSPTDDEMVDLLFAWKVAKYVKSNAIIYAQNERTIGVGAGQMSRVNSARIAVIKADLAGLQVRGAVMASDAFFPFRDGLDQAGQAGIKAVIQPGGSTRDEEVIQAADEHDIAMVFTSMRHFRH